MKRNIEAVMKAGGQGVKVTIGGRLDGAEIARREMLSQGKMPLHTLRADIDYSRTIAETSYGVIGIKVWIYKGEYFGKVEESKR
jgi:small subunit ribosomal protein S3